MDKKITGTTTKDSPVLSDMTSTEGIQVGMTAAGSNIPNGSKVVSVDGEKQVTIDQKCLDGDTRITFVFTA